MRIHTIHKMPGRIALAICLSFLCMASAPALAPPHDSSNNITCSSCHAMHSGVFGGILPRGTDQEDQCKSCHNATGPANSRPSLYEVTNHVVDSGATIIDCGSCHNPHGPRTVTDTHLDGITAPNLSLVTDDPQEYVPTALTSVIFQTKPDHFAFATTPFNGMCQTCHTTTDFYTNSAEETVHEVGGDCSSCHPHADSFAGGGSCSDCHSTTQGGRRAMVGEFSLASHHVLTAIDDADCEVCHDMGSHKGGKVKVKYVDAATVVTLDADPNTTSAEAVKLEGFCLDCHDSNGAGGSAPFSDVTMPPVIDNTAWSSSGHKAGSVTCYGDGAFGCHASGHGSEKIELLAPYDVAPTAPPANVEEEEGFCFNCHDSDGPAGTDIDAQFATAARWVTDVVAGNDNLNLNDRHDIVYDVQSTSGAKMECSDCHDPHTATDANPLKADPDPDDGRVPGTGQVLAGADFQTEWCLDCHDGSLPSTITAPTTALMNIRDAFTSDDSHGIPGGNATLKAGYGWAEAGSVIVPCLACHAPHSGARSKRNLFQLKDLVKSMDGLTNIPSDGVGLNYELTDNNIKNAAINGFEWCNTCHAGSMGGKKADCFSCHYHGRNM